MLLRLLDAQSSSPGSISGVDRVKTINLESWICDCAFRVCQSSVANTVLEEYIDCYVDCLFIGTHVRMMLRLSDFDRHFRPNHYAAGEN